MVHNYGLSEHERRVNFCTKYRGDYLMNPKEPKKVFVVNALDCKDVITVGTVKERLIGLGWDEWEELFAFMIVKSIVESIEEGKEADISSVFSCDLVGEYVSRNGDKIIAEPTCKKQDSVIEFLLTNLFEKIGEENGVMRVRIIV